MSIFSNPLTEPLLGAFHEWGKNHATYKTTYKKLTNDSFGFIRTAISELDILAPGPLWTWYTRHHMRFRHFNNENLRLTMELLQMFLADYAHDRLRKPKPNQKNETSTGSSSNRSLGSNGSCGVSVNPKAKKPSD